MLKSILLASALVLALAIPATGQDAVLYPATVADTTMDRSRLKTLSDLYHQGHWQALQDELGSLLEDIDLGPDGTGWKDPADPVAPFVFVVFPTEKRQIARVAVGRPHDRFSSVIPMRGASTLIREVFIVGDSAGIDARYTMTREPNPLTGQVTPVLKTLVPGAGVALTALQSVGPPPEGPPGLKAAPGVMAPPQVVLRARTVRLPHKRGALQIEDTWSSTYDPYADKPTFPGVASSRPDAPPVEGSGPSTDGRLASTDGRLTSTDGRFASTDGRLASEDGRRASSGSGVGSRGDDGDTSPAAPKIDTLKAEAKTKWTAQPLDKLTFGLALGVVATSSGDAMAQRKDGALVEDDLARGLTAAVATWYPAGFYRDGEERLGSRFGLMAGVAVLPKLGPLAGVSWRLADDLSITVGAASLLIDSPSDPDNLADSKLETGWRTAGFFGITVPAG